MLVLTGCELAGDFFKAGVWVGDSFGGWRDRALRLDGFES